MEDRHGSVCSRSLCDLLVAPAFAQAPKVGDPPEAYNMRLVGMNDLQARSAYQPTIHRQGERYIAYIGHHGGTPEVPKPVNKMTGQAEFNGTSILDVTDPANPKYLKHLPGLEGNYEEGGAQMVRVCDGRTLPKGDPAKTYMLRVFGGKAHEIWDVTDPANPALLTRLGKRTRHAQELVGVRHRHRLPRLRHLGLAHAPHDAGLRPQRSGEAACTSATSACRARSRARPARCRPSCTAAISTGPQGNRIYFGYGTNKGGVLQIVDREKLLNGPKEPTPTICARRRSANCRCRRWSARTPCFRSARCRIPEFAGDKSAPSATS